VGVPWFKKSSGQDQPPAERVFGGPLSSIEPLRDEVITQHEPGHGEISFRWILARAAA